MKPFIINTYDYGPWSGGVKVMHKLCDILNKNGYPSYIMPIFPRSTFTTCSDYYTPLITREIFENINDAIVLYPEGIKYNPLNAKNVVRWILGQSKEEDASTYSKTDLIYYINDYYYNDKLGQRENNLYVVEFHSDIFKNNNIVRNGSCYTIRKGQPHMFVHPSDSKIISYSDAGNLQWLSDLFNSSEKFYCYDNHTFLYTQAAMCGCISIVVPESIFTKEQWLNGSRLHKYGVAYGEDDIPRAIATLPLLYEEIENVKKDMVEGVINFAENCLNVFK